MKKWVCLLLLLFLLLFGAKWNLIQQFFQDKIEVLNPEPGASSASSNTINIAKNQIYQGNLLLINKDHPVRDEAVKTDIVNLSQHRELVNGYSMLDSSISLSEGVALKFRTMVAAAEKEGVRHFIISSGYRNFKEQERLYQKMGSAYALPAGYSEHNSGLSLDIGSTQTEMNGAPEGKWLAKNDWKYGFVLRYPKDKAAITGIQYEPWHFRYVGLPHSAIMQEKKMVLEQYLDYLKEKKNISVRLDGKKYSISYYPVSQNTGIEVPVNHNYEISGNNIDGVIVTLYE